MPARLSALVALLLTVSGVMLIAPASPAHAAGDKDCGDFATQAAAQQYFINKGGPQADPDNLDADGDGIACEDNPCPCSSSKGGGGDDTQGTESGTKTGAKKHNLYGAIAVNPKTGGASFRNNTKTKHAAVSGARSKCRSHAAPGSCVVAGWVRNGCVYVAARVVDGDLMTYRTAKASTLKKARAKARAKLAGPANQKRLWARLCTSRHG